MGTGFTLATKTWKAKWGGRSHRNHCAPGYSNASSPTEPGCAVEAHAVALHQDPEAAPGSHLDTGPVHKLAEQIVPDLNRGFLEHQPHKYLFSFLAGVEEVSAGENDWLTTSIGTEAMCFKETREALGAACISSKTHAFAHCLSRVRYKFIYNNGLKATAPQWLNSTS